MRKGQGLPAKLSPLASQLWWVREPVRAAAVCASCCRERGETKELKQGLFLSQKAQMRPGKQNNKTANKQIEMCRIILIFILNGQSLCFVLFCYVFLIFGALAALTALYFQKLFSYTFIHYGI